MKKLITLLTLILLSCDSGGFKFENNTEYIHDEIFIIKQLDSIAIDNLGTATDFKSTKIVLEPSFGSAKDIGWKSIGVFYYSQGPLNYVQSFGTDGDNKVIPTGQPVNADFFDN